MAPPKHRFRKLQEVLFIDKINVLSITWMCSIASSVLKHRLACARSHVTAPELPRHKQVSDELGQQANETCAQLCLLGLSAVRSIALGVIERTGQGPYQLFDHFHPFNRNPMLTTCSTIKH
jgi:hypothetical protein